MPAARIAESHLEEHTLAWLRELGYTTLFGPDIAHGEARAERDDWHEVILKHRLVAAIARLNPDIPADAQEAALRKILHPDSPSLVGNNRVFHRMLVDGVEVEYRRPDGTIRGDQYGWQTSIIRRRTTGLPSTSLPSSRTTTTGDPTFSCSSTGFLLSSSNSRTRPMRKQPLKPRSGRSRPTNSRSPPSSRITRWP